MQLFDTMAWSCPQLRSLTLNMCEGLPAVLRKLKAGTVLPNLLQLDIAAMHADDDDVLEGTVFSLSHARPELNIDCQPSDNNELAFEDGKSNTQILQENPRRWSRNKSFACYKRPV